MFGRCKIHNDKSVIYDYLAIIGETELPKNSIIIEESDNAAKIKLAIK